MSWNKCLPCTIFQEHPWPFFNLHLFPGTGRINCNLTNVQRGPRPASKTIQGTERLTNSCGAEDAWRVSVPKEGIFTSSVHAYTHTESKLSENIHDYDLFARKVLGLFQPANEASNLGWHLDLLIFLIPNCFTGNIELFLIIADNELASLALDHL